MYLLFLNVSNLNGGRVGSGCWNFDGSDFVDKTVVAVDNLLKCIECKLQKIINVLHRVSYAKGHLDLEGTVLKNRKLSVGDADIMEGGLDGGGEGDLEFRLGIEVNNPLQGLEPATPDALLRNWLAIDVEEEGDIAILSKHGEGVSLERGGANLACESERHGDGGVWEETSEFYELGTVSFLQGRRSLGYGNPLKGFLPFVCPLVGHTRRRRHG
jgi:hypothetical protein